MSRIGNAPVAIPKGVTVNAKGRTLGVKGPKGTLSYDVPDGIEFNVEAETITFKPERAERRLRALQGTARALTANMVTGCSTGFERTLEIVGVGYRAAVKGQNVDLTLGFSHPISYALPKEVTAEVTKDGKLILRSANKAVLGQVAADIRRYRPPEPYKGKGVRYSDEHIIRKEGKGKGKK